MSRSLFGERQRKNLFPSCFLRGYSTVEPKAVYDTCSLIFGRFYYLLGSRGGRSGYVGKAIWSIQWNIAKLPTTTAKMERAQPDTPAEPGTGRKGKPIDQEFFAALWYIPKVCTQFDTKNWWPAQKGNLWPPFSRTGKNRSQHGPSRRRTPQAKLIFGLLAFCSSVSVGIINVTLCILIKPWLFGEHGGTG